MNPSDAPHLDASLVSCPANVADTSGGRPFFLVRKLSASALWACRRDLASVSVVDPRAFGYFEDWEYRQLRRWLVDGRCESKVTAVDQLFALQGETALLLGTGPSSVTFSGEAANWDVRIVCNSTVRNRELLVRLRPNVITFGDGVFHFGPSRYARAFRDDLRRAVDLMNPVLVVPDDYYSLLMSAMPDLEDRTVALRFGASTFTVPSRAALSVKTTGNVLTNLMLPIGAMLCEKIDIAGCDGRKPNEEYFWRHGRTVQYGDELMQSAFAAHPSFFRDQNYDGYYKLHCDELGEFIRVLEYQGKRVQSVTPSLIPALYERGQHR